MPEIAIIGCFAAVLILTPLAARLGWRIGAVDIPRDGRRMHTDSLPRSGGIALFFVYATMTVIVCPRTLATAAGLFGGAAVFCIGLADDVGALPPPSRLAVQTLAAVCAAIGAGVGSPFELAVAVLWLVTMTNAHNFIDGLDGLLAGTVINEGIATAFLLWLIGHGANALPPLFLAVAALGFLQYNRPPARVFAGDCGSGTLGFLLGLAALPTLLQPTWQLGVLAPLLVFAYPLTDLTAAVLRRAASGMSPFCADRAHLHHRICAMGVSQPRCVALLCAVSAPLCLCGVLTASEALSPFASASAAACCAVLLLIRASLPRSERKKRKNACKQSKSMV